jgi:hypothetical protein
MTRLIRQISSSFFYCVDIILQIINTSGQSSCLQIQRPGFDSRRYQIFWEVVGLERGPLSHVSTIEELLEIIRHSDSGLENRDYGRRNPSRWSRATLYPQTLALTSATSVGRSVGIVRWWTQVTEFKCCSPVDSHHQRNTETDLFHSFWVPPSLPRPTKWYIVKQIWKAMAMKHIIGLDHFG